MIVIYKRYHRAKNYRSITVNIVPTVEFTVDEHPYHISIFLSLRWLLWGVCISYKIEGEVVK